MIQIAEMIAWAAFAALCTRVSWHRSEAVIGLSLLICSLVTSAAYFGSTLSSRLVLEICQALCVTFTARIAFAATRSPIAAIVVLLAAADAALAGALSLAWSDGGITGRAASRYLGWGSNIVFGLQCLLVGVPGALDVLSRRLPDRDPGRRMDHAAGTRNAARDLGRPS